MEPVRSSLSIVGGLPREKVGSAPATVFSGPAQRSLTLRPARSRSRLATLYTEGSDSFVTSAAASIATGWSEPVPGRELHPLKSSAFHGALFHNGDRYAGEPSCRELRYCHSESEAALHIMTPSRMVKLRCPICHASHWEIQLRLSWELTSLAEWRAFLIPSATISVHTARGLDPGLRSSSEVPPRVFPSATRAVSDERKRLRVLGVKIFEAELSKTIQCWLMSIKTWRPSGGAGLRRILPA